MVGVFKRAAGLNLASQQIGSSFFGATNGEVLNREDRDMRRAADECCRAYTGLAVGSGFLEFEEKSGLGGNGIVNGGAGRGLGYAGGGFT